MPKLGRKVPCPCGTGMTYEDCCLARGIKWMVDEEGKAYRVVALSQEATQELINFMKEQKVEFKKVFGRDPGPNDKIFFQDAYLRSPDDNIKDIVQLMKKAGLPPDKIYATKKTGLIPTEENWDKLTTKDIEDWREAIDEYYEKLDQGKSPLDEEESHPLEEARKAEAGEGEYSEFISEATVFSLLIVTMILDETRKTNIVDIETKSDITRFLQKIIPKLTDFFQRKVYVYEDKDYSEIIKDRLGKIPL